LIPSNRARTAPANPRVESRAVKMDLGEAVSRLTDEMGIEEKVGWDDRILAWPHPVVNQPEPKSRGLSRHQEMNVSSLLSTQLYEAGRLLHQLFFSAHPSAIDNVEEDQGRLDRRCTPPRECDHGQEEDRRECQSKKDGWKLGLGKRR
jgi:hypothetical protein